MLQTVPTMYVPNLHQPPPHHHLQNLHQDRISQPQTGRNPSALSNKITVSIPNSKLRPLGWMDSHLPSINLCHHPVSCRHHLQSSLPLIGPIFLLLQWLLMEPNLISIESWTPPNPPLPRLQNISLEIYLNLCMQRHPSRVLWEMPPQICSLYLLTQ